MTHIRMMCAEDANAGYAMQILLIKSIAPVILIAGLVTSLSMGVLKCRLLPSIALGWFLFVLSFLFQDLFSPMMAHYSSGREGVKAVAVDQPGTIAAIFIGWIYSTICHFLGRFFRYLFDLIARRRNKNKSD